MAIMFQRYRCVVDGNGEFRGEPLPTGTEDEILTWIKARYKVLGELYAVNGDWRYGCIGIINLMIDPSLWGDFRPEKPTPVTKRYLVEVEGVEKMFVLHPIPAGLFDWDPRRSLPWSGAAEYETF
ncbi:MAG: hypothetical protein J6U40_07390 [Kiritimatiellae bacterium]|nr:hypothetical protein [Kiritimatiellia bacterium]